MYASETMYCLAHNIASYHNTVQILASTQPYNSDSSELSLCHFNKTEVQQKMKCTSMLDMNKHGSLDVDCLCNFVAYVTPTAPPFPPGISFVNLFNFVDMILSV